MAEDEVNFDLGFDLPGRFGTTSKNKKKQDELLTERNRQSTQRATRGAIKALNDYLSEKNYDKTMDDLTDEELPTVLFDFYSDLRKQDGKMYKLQSIKCIRAGLNRHTKASRNIDIIKDVKFAQTNEMFTAVSKQICKAGLGTTKSYPTIEPDDLATISQFFTHDWMNAPDPKKIQKCLLFSIIYFFCRRGRENIYDFTQEMFQLETDPSGTQYVFQAVDEMDKNHGIDVTDKPNDGYMYEQTDCQLCPVSIYKLYMSKIHKDIPFLWQRPKQGKLHWNDKYWYDKVQVGRETLENFMSILSAEANLSRRYTNHSIRSTVMAILSNKYEGCLVIGWSGHKSESTVKQYVKKIPTAKKREMCGELAQNILPKAPKKDEAPTIPATISNPQAENASQNAADLQFVYEELNAPIDPVLENFLATFDMPQNMQQIQEEEAPLQVEPQQKENVANSIKPLNEIQNLPIPQQPTVNMAVQNVQNVNPNRTMPAMYFPNSNVTINYHFHK